MEEDERMDKKIAGLLSAVAAVATIGGAQASTTPGQPSSDPLAAQSYADLLTPIPNATEALVADNARLDTKAAGEVELAQYYHHHHHHHHHHWRRYYHHHHHHHHHWRRYYHHHHHHHHTFIGVPGVGGVVVR
jgi:hypothetical protein